ncbi:MULTISPECIES: ABC transporter substrate-binding protein [Kitasatospora]|uniref:Putative ABC transporter substrate-binding protein n=1 Tax=Kitasatospora setae (strain ATCC 33774 / DSM 43861 / JCM 3304 / KCC A-0304 / NBRC 14216 / KM-6054) TaxID=452652 RepID=E4NGX8_KITSK|nr:MULTISPECIES: ABC transporter substrate-binding protein [Kitasatospora]BAJ30758.1 putative ABC transporter substrate-binding protein [Kitasatospora setae KM-6054]
MKRHLPALALASVAALALAGCGSDPAAAPKAAPVGIQPSQDVLSGVHKSDAAAALLPDDVKAAGTIKLGGAVGTPPGAYYPEGKKELAGLDVDLVNGVAAVLGVKVQREDAAFETILPALGSGKYDVGTGNFGVTTARLKTVDFVTYIDDGQGFAVRSDNTALNNVTDLTQLCGLTVGTGAGTTFEATLNAKKDDCAKAGKKPYDVKVFTENGAVLTGLQQGRLDVVMSTINGLRYQANQPTAKIRFLGEFHRLDVGFAFKKGSTLTPAFQAAVNQLIKDGTYQKILAKWGTADSAITESQINPPEHP